MKRVCELSDLAGGASVRFGLGGSPGGPRPGGPARGAREGFVLIAPDGEPRAYLNVCPHRGQPVDLGDGRLRLPGGKLECQAHGAVFAAATGACVGGPCSGAGLTPLALEVRGAAVFVRDDPPDDLAHRLGDDG